MGNGQSQQTTDVAKLLEDLEKTRIEREIAFAQIQERRRLAFKLAEEREKFNWIACGSGLVVVLSALSSFHHKNLLHIVPIFPTASFVGYKAHFCYGDQMQRIKDAASLFLEDKADVLVPLPPTVADVKNRAKQLKQFADDEIY